MSEQITCADCKGAIDQQGRCGCTGYGEYFEDNKASGQGSFYELGALKDRINEYERVRVALETINSYSDTPMTWDEIIAKIEGEAHRLQAESLKGLPK